MRFLSLACLTCTLFLTGCMSSLTAFRDSQHNATIEELRMEVADLKHALHGTEVEIKLLEERLEVSENYSTAAKTDETTDLNKKITSLERTIDKINSEIRSLMHFTSQTTASLSQYRDHILAIDHKLDEIAKLRSTLTELSRTTRSPASSTIYEVRSGDSLERIARHYNVDVEALKSKNNLSSDKIIVGQKLSIPSSD